MRKIPERTELHPLLMLLLAYFSILGSAVFVGSILLADFIVPNHDWIADTISDLGAGKYEFIVDIGIYAFSASILAIALLAAHVHLGGWRWSVGIIGLAVLSLIVFLIGARNEYGDNDSDGVVIHIYLVYAVGLIMAVVPWLMSHDAARVGDIFRTALVWVSVIWTMSAPIFFFLPTEIDGIYERYLGVIAISAVVIFARLFVKIGQVLR